MKTEGHNYPDSAYFSLKSSFNISLRLSLIPPYGDICMVDWMCWMYLIAVYLSVMNCLKGVSRVTAHFYINEHRRGSLRVENETWKWSWGVSVDWGIAALSHLMGPVQAGRAGAPSFLFPFFTRQNESPRSHLAPLQPLHSSMSGQVCM